MSDTPKTDEYLDLILGEDDAQNHPHRTVQSLIVIARQLERELAQCQRERDSVVKALDHMTRELAAANARTVELGDLLERSYEQCDSVIAELDVAYERAAQVCLDIWQQETNPTYQNAISHGCVESAKAIRALKEKDSHESP